MTREIAETGLHLDHITSHFTVIFQRVRTTDNSFPLFFFFFQEMRSSVLASGDEQVEAVQTGAISGKFTHYEKTQGESPAWFNSISLSTDNMGRLEVDHMPVAEWTLGLTC